MGDLFLKIAAIGIMVGITVHAWREPWPGKLHVDGNWWADSLGILPILGLLILAAQHSLDAAMTVLLGIAALVMIVVLSNWALSWYRHNRDTTVVP